MLDNVIYRSPLVLSPKKRLDRTISGLLFALQQDRPLISTEEARTWLGLSLCHNRRHLINQTLSSLEQGK